MRKWTIAFLFAVSSINVTANEGFCGVNEDSFFHCRNGNKQISLCASKNLTEHSGYVQYRFGTNNKIDFEYPSEKKSPKGLFFESDLTWSQDIEKRLHFSNNTYTYMLFSRSFTVENDDTSGVYIFKGNKYINQIGCKESNTAFSKKYLEYKFEHKDSLL